MFLARKDTWIATSQKSEEKRKFEESAGKEELLEKECKKFNMNFVGLTETKRKGPGGHYYTHEGSLMMPSKAENRKHGVGAIVDKWTAKKVIGYEGINDRIMIV